MKIQQWEDKGLSHFSYAILSECASEIALVDPARNPEPYLNFASDFGRHPIPVRSALFLHGLWYSIPVLLILGAHENRFITLADGALTAQIVETLVNAGFPVEGIWQHEQTVEDFYLSLVKPPPLPKAN